MAVTGFMMWNPIATARWFPGQTIPAAKTAHGGEAILAVLAILLWHFYHVHLRHFNKSMLTGKLSREEMEEDHPAELAMIEAGQAPQPPPPSALQRRRRYFIPIATVLTGALLFAVYKFVTFEQTAITTLPPAERAPVFVPQTPTPAPTRAPTTTPAGVEALSWQGGIQALLRNRCDTCHGTTAVGGLSLATYEGALEGGESGPGIVPDFPSESLVVQVQEQGDHPGQLSDEELGRVIEWIEAGAPER
jgi:hypothetical protein